MVSFAVLGRKMKYGAEQNLFFIFCHVTNIGEKLYLCNE